jgi:hypothetical protein
MISGRAIFVFARAEAGLFGVVVSRRGVTRLRPTSA